VKTLSACILFEIKLLRREGGSFSFAVAAAKRLNEPANRNHMEGEDDNDIELELYYIASNRLGTVEAPLVVGTCLMTVPHPS
jgi:hypothetical protein